MSADKEKIQIRFDGPPSHESGRFVEVEDSEGKSFKLGEWVQDGDDYLLVFTDPRRAEPLAGCSDPKAFVQAVRNTLDKLVKDGVIDPVIKEVADYRWLWPEAT